MEFNKFGLNGTFRMVANCQKMCHFCLKSSIILKPVVGIASDLGRNVILKLFML